MASVGSEFVPLANALENNRKQIKPAREMKRASRFTNRDNAVNDPGLALAHRPMDPLSRQGNALFDEGR